MRMSAVALLAVLTCAMHAGEPSPYVRDYAASVQRQLRTLETLAAIAAESPLHYPDAAMKQTIDGHLNALLSIEDLSTFALLANTLQSGLAEHQNYDGVFDYAQWRCIERIAATPGKGAQLALVHLKPTLGNDGHPSEMFRELIEKQKRLQP